MSKTGHFNVAIPSREQIITDLEAAGKPLKRRQIAQLYDLNESEEREAIRRRLRAMVRDGQLIENRRGAYGLVRNMDLVSGRVQAHTDGFGFVIPDEGGEDLFLSSREMRRVLHRDRVLANVIGVDQRGRKEGTVVEILERANKHIVGRFIERGGVAMVEPDNVRITQDVLVPLDQTLAARPGQVVVVEIDKQPGYRQPLIGHITEILGRSGAPGMAVEIAIRNFDLPIEFPKQVLAEAEAFGNEIDHSSAEVFRGRKDLRKQLLVTIDGADARDFDDAVFCQPNANGWQLVVAIADVSAYVTPGSALDKEALDRGTSVYFPNRVLPMLPEALSNGMCSLKPQVDRLSMVCDMQIDQGGKVKRSRFYRALIHSHARLTYDQAWEMVSASDKPANADRQSMPEVAVMLDDLYQLFHALHAQRVKRGAIDFNSTEVQFLFGPGGEISDIVPYSRNDAHKIIEECMISANVEAARFLQKNKVPALYRVHEPPPPLKLQKLEEFLRAQGLPVTWKKQPTPADLAAIVKQIADRPDRELIEAVLLRSMSMAVYVPENLGHFGLALDAYGHFTSPIRRYPDLQVHRAIGHILDRQPDNTGNQAMKDLGVKCSMLERRAEEASRDVDQRLKCGWLEQHIGESFSAQVTGVTAFGLFVELRDSHVSGLLHVTALPNDYYSFDPIHHRLTGKRGGKVYRLADTLMVEVLNVDMEERKIDFALAKNGKTTHADKK
ncbi:MAG: ribonuclease R [Xanthomonadales bacterium]|nr:ribonuclease R [Xanthomonadales bacterium]